MLTHLQDVRTGQALMSGVGCGMDCVNSSIQPYISFVIPAPWELLRSWFFYPVVSLDYFFFTWNYDYHVFCIFIEVDSWYLSQLWVLHTYKILVNATDLSLIGYKIKIWNKNYQKTTMQTFVHRTDIYWGLNICRVLWAETDITLPSWRLAREQVWIQGQTPEANVDFHLWWVLLRGGT